MSMIKSISVKDGNASTWEKAEKLASGRGESMSAFVARLLHIEVQRVELARAAARPKGGPQQQAKVLLEEMMSIGSQARDLLIQAQPVES